MLWTCAWIRRLGMSWEGPEHKREMKTVPQRYGKQSFESLREMITVINCRSDKMEYSDLVIGVSLCAYLLNDVNSAPMNAA